MTRQKIWFITGSGSGFGRIWAEAALARGDKVAATDRNPEKLSALVGAYGDSVMTPPLDVTDRPSVFRVVNEAHRHFGRLDVIISNAGYGYEGALEEVDFDEYRVNFDTNVFGTVSVIQAALPLLRAQRSGHIITLSSIGGLIGFPAGGSYGATKFAIEGLTESLAGDVASFGIKVTMLEPGSFATGFKSSMRAAPKMAEYDVVREAAAANFRPELSGDPKATAGAILRLVDSDKPPLRLMLGSHPLPSVREVYAKRLETWAEWAEVSNAAQGPLNA